MSPEPDAFRVVFHGVRGSYEAPGAAYAGYGGRTTCCEVFAGGHRVIFDAGSGIIPLGADLAAASRERRESIRLTLCMTHYHHDHVCGLLFFRPFFFTGTRLTLVGPCSEVGSAAETVADVLKSPFSPLAFDELRMQRECRDIADGQALRFAPGAAAPVLVDEQTDAPADVLEVRALHAPNHPKRGVLNYRVRYRDRAFVLATDIEGAPAGDPALADFARGADLLAHDAMFTDEEYERGDPPRRGWGHSMPAMALATARQAGARKLALIHHAPEHDDAALDEIERTLQQDFPTCFLAREGQAIGLL